MVHMLQSHPTNSAPTHLNIVIRNLDILQTTSVIDFVYVNELTLHKSFISLIGNYRYKVKECAYRNLHHISNCTILKVFITVLNRLC